jgi:2-polyprenyl-3-methyl-5-hydroxy-6-metoxy-1,4-benzoquinol methylase
MPRLTPTDFNTARFFGYDGNMPGGYGLYQPVHYSVNPAFSSSPENDAWYRRAQKFIESGGLVGRKIIELGCAWGSLVRYLRSLGADAYGLDLSWPISQGIALWPELEPYLIVADARTWITTQKKNSWDAIISRGFLDCLTDAELATFIPAMNNACIRQVHIVDPDIEAEYYNRKTLAEWRVLPWQPGTVISDKSCLN